MWPAKIPWNAMSKILSSRSSSWLQIGKRPPAPSVIWFFHGAPEQTYVTDKNSFTEIWIENSDIYKTFLRSVHKNQALHPSVTTELQIDKCHYSFKSKGFFFHKRSQSIWLQSFPHAFHQKFFTWYHLLWYLRWKNDLMIIPLSRVLTKYQRITCIKKSIH